MYELAKLTSDNLVALAAYGARAVWPAGFNVYERGGVAEGLFIVTRGRIVLRCRGKAGRGFIPSIVMPGGTFGGEGLVGVAQVSASNTYVSDARADDETETLHLGVPNFRALVREQPQLALALVGQMMAERAASVERLRELATLGVEPRLMSILSRLARRRTFVGEDGRLNLDASAYRVLCELVGATRESVSLVLNRLVADGVAERHEGGVIIDPHELQHHMQDAAWLTEVTIPITDERPYMPSRVQ